MKKYLFAIALVVSLLLCLSLRPNADITQEMRQNATSDVATYMRSHFPFAY